MKSNFRTCPQCSTRNRLDKEYCVKCGEPLEGIKAGDDSAPAPAKRAAFGVTQTREDTSPIVPLVFVLAALGVAVAGWRYASNAPATAPQARPSFSPPPALAAVPVPPGPGSEEYRAGMAAFRAGDFPNAVRLLRLAVTAANQAEYRFGLAEALEKSGAASGQYLAEYEGAATAAPTNVRYVSEWAKALNRAGRNTDALRAYEASLALDPEDLANVREVANLYLRANDLAGARPFLETIVRLQPDDLGPKQDLARALELTHDLNGAVRQYREILAGMPEAHMSRALLSEILMKQNHPDDALKLIDEGITIDASAALLHRERGRILDRQGKGDQAIVAYREYIRRAPGASDLAIFKSRIEQLSLPTTEQED